ncbi:MAG: DNA repair exonuclease [Lachnospiraceae bacterium]|nr:DNA repair exonuclease [Lachnospiraceae bacterium]
MTFIHVSDVHIGNIPDSDKPWGKDREFDISDTFSCVIKKCKELNCDLLLISGDLFHRQPLTSDLNTINDLFKTIPNTTVVATAGNKDYIRPNSAILSYNFASNVHYFLNDYPEVYEIPDLNCVIHGFSYRTQEINRPIIDTIEVKEDDKTHILIAHGGDQNHVPIDFDRLKQKNFSYVALGHIHKHEEIDDHIVYAGSLEPQSQQEIKEHGIYIGEINTMTRRLENLHFEPMAKVSYIPLTIKISETTTREALINSIEQEMNTRGINNIYKLRLEGDRNPDVEFNLHILESKYRILDVIDETEPKYDFAELSREHPNDMIGAFIRSFQEKDIDDMSYVQKKALFYGINALLKTRDH